MWRYFFFALFENIKKKSLKFFANLLSDYKDLGSSLNPNILKPNAIAIFVYSQSYMYGLFYQLPCTVQNFCQKMSE